MRMSHYEGAGLYGTGGKRLGTVDKVLFHPSEPRAVALMVSPVPWLVVIRRPKAYVPLASTRVEGGYLRIDGSRLPSKRKAEKAIGHDLETTVIWHGMPVHSRDGDKLGTVDDVALARDGGTMSMEITAGGFGDLTHGRREVPGELVGGFDGRAVTVLADLDQVETSGGLVKKAAEGVASAKTKADSVAAATGATVVGAGMVAGKAIRSAAQSEVGKRARGAWKGLTGAFREGYRGDEEKK